MREILLTQGQVALVDDEDYERLNQFKWYADKKKNGSTFYAKRNVQISAHKRTGVKMHREIMHAKLGEIVDHINGNGLDNRKSKLRITTNQKNCFNTKSHKNTSSKYKGVAWHIRRKKWQVNICKDGENIYLGLHESEEKAAIIYNTKALELFGEFARLNIIGGN